MRLWEVRAENQKGDFEHWGPYVFKALFHLMLNLKEMACLKVEVTFWLENFNLTPIP